MDENEISEDSSSHTKERAVSAGAISEKNIRKGSC